MQRIGRYEVVEHLASGGMGRVYLARMTGMGGFERHVVVKALMQDFEDEALVTMFLDEARVLGALHHHFIAPVYEVGRDADGRYFLVMDYVHGETVESVLKASLEQGDAIPLPFALTVVSSIASALDYAHTLRAPDGTPLRIVHRDVSLSNIMIGYDGAVKLIDFGIAKAANRATKTLTGTLKGKLGYLAPEQVRHEPIDHRADIFALGIVLYELTTMTRAFAGASELETLERITKGQIVPPSELVPDYPRALELILMKALAIDPDDRYQDAATMGRELEELAHRLGLQLGHATLAGTMRTLFDRGRRRLARASSELALTPAPPVLAAARALAPAYDLDNHPDDAPTRRVPMFDEADLAGEDDDDDVLELRPPAPRTAAARAEARTSRRLDAARDSVHERPTSPALVRTSAMDNEASGEAIVPPPIASQQAVAVPDIPPVVVRFAPASTPPLGEVALPDARVTGARPALRPPIARAATALPAAGGTSRAGSSTAELLRPALLGMTSTTGLLALAAIALVIWVALALR